MLLVTPCGFGDTAEGSTCDRAEGDSLDDLYSTRGKATSSCYSPGDTESREGAPVRARSNLEPPVFSELKQRSSLTAPCLITCSYKHSRGRIQRSVLLLERGRRVNKALPVLNPGARWGQAPRPPQGACTVLPGLPRLAP